MNLEDESLVAQLEAILFSAGEPLDAGRISDAIFVSRSYVEAGLQALQEQLAGSERGICLLRLGDSYQLCSKKEYAQDIQKVLEVKRNQPLSPAAFEVLAVVAYNQPVTKAYIEQVRGVDCSGVVATLCQKGLVEEKGRLDLPGRPLVYGTTTEFLKCFCLESLADLPDLPADPQEEQAPEKQPFEQLSMESIAEGE